ncbi:MAG: dTDP-4-dehydrorhamnose 3,5-epimerase family protein [Pyrinomonadaceae bacterium]|nr:dTDP-4-dehydrorhamnose 3,5-epimerase family protein [Pyrinomonadaceae bacterium]
MQSEPKLFPVTFRAGVIHDVVVRQIRKHIDERGWLAELFRQDELAEEFYPEMAYISTTLPGVTRGPHAHKNQADLTCFIGASDFKVRLWDYRPDSKTYRNMMTLFAGEDNPLALLIPKGIVHAYRNIGSVSGIAINCPNKLYRGKGCSEEPDDIRYEDDPHTIFRMDD